MREQLNSGKIIKYAVWGITQKADLICSYLENNVTKNIDFSSLCEKFKLSKTTMKKMFRNNLGFGAMDYFSRCKIDCAKHLIREKEMNLAEISDYLCFSSQQYFSKRFKSIAGMTPSEYMKSVING